MIRARIYCLTCACITILMGTSAHAQIILTIDTAAKNWELSGAATGQPGLAGGSTYEVFWSQPFFVGSTALTDLQNPAFTNAGWMPSFSIAQTAETATGFAEFRAELSQTTSGDDLSTITVTVSAIGGPIDYSGHSTAYKSAFEGLVGGSVPLLIGTGFGDISVQGVPEPTSFALFGIALVGMARRRRQR